MSAKSTKSSANGKAGAKKKSAQLQNSKHKAANSNATKSNVGKKNKLWILLAIVVFGIFVAIILFWGSTPKQDTSNVLVRVNDVPITKTEFGFQYNLLPENYRSSFSQEQVLEQIIDEELVVQAAKRNGNNVSLQEVNERIQKILASTGISLSDLQKNLDGYNITQEQFESLVQRQLLIERYLKDKIVQIPIDDAMVKSAYDASQEKYAVAEQVTVRHVLIAAQQTDAAVLAKSIYDRARTGEDFCLLVKNFTNDKGSKETCGQYTFPRGFMVPEFEQASFDMKPNDVRMVQTQFGYHIIVKMNSTPASVKPYESVKSLIIDELQAMARAKQYRDILNDLRSAATIRYQNGTVIAPVRAPSISAAGEQPVNIDANTAANVPTAPEPTLPEPGASATPVLPSAPATPESNVVAPAPEVVAPVEPVAVQPAPQVPAQTAPAPSSTPTVVATTHSTSAVDGIDVLQTITCIAGKSTLYGMSWSSDTQSAQNIFATAGVPLSYVDCGKDAALCKEKGVIAYPTWNINGKNYLGAMTVQQLAQATSC